MGWFDRISSSIHKSVTEVEEGATKAVSAVQKEASAMASKAKEAASKAAQLPEWPEPSKAMDEQYAKDIAAFAKAQMQPSIIPTNAPSLLPMHCPGDLLQSVFYSLLRESMRRLGAALRAQSRKRLFRAVLAPALASIRSRRL